MYLLNFFSSLSLTKSLKKKFPIEYNAKAPNESDNTDITVPSHCPNSIPEIIKIGEPNPSNITQTIPKMKKKHKLINMLELM